jgi:UPF0716 protein FxsA
MGLLFLLFIAVPVIEIALFIVIGEQIGLGAILVIVLLTGLLGAFLVSRQGRGVLRQMGDEVRLGQSPAPQIAHGAMILVGGALLLTPGFLTDVVGFALMVPAVRERLRRFVVRRFRSRIEIIDV